jgi:hypothetical protein
MRIRRFAGSGPSCPALQQSIDCLEGRVEQAKLRALASEACERKALLGRKEEENVELREERRALDETLLQCQERIAQLELSIRARVQAAAQSGT